MTTSLLTDFDADATSRLLRLLDERNVSCRDLLKRSAAVAGAQLEWAKPSVMGSDKRDHRRIYAGPAVMAPVGTVFLVLADHRKVLTIWLRHTGTLAEAVEGSVGYVNAAKDASEASAINWAGDHALLIADEVIQKYGHLPGKNGVELEPEHNGRIIGMLFAVMPADARADIIKGLEMVVAEDICPAMICLIGKGRTKGLSGVWPLLLPLAPYADAVLA